MIDFIKRHKLGCGVMIFDVVVLLIVGLVLVMNGARSATIEIYVAPVEAKVVLNGQEYKNFASYDVAPGEYHVVISMEGMQTKEYDLNVADDEFLRIRTFLLDSDGGFEYYRRHFDDELILANVADTKEAKAFVSEYSKIHEIIDILPIEYSAYSDDYSDYKHYEIIQNDREECTAIVCLKIIDYTGGNEQLALERIKEEGFNPSDYDIKYELVLNESVRTSDE